MASLLITTVAAFVHPPSALAFIPLIAAAVLALSHTDGLPAATQYRQMRLGAAIALVAAAAAIVATLILRLLPWRTLIAAFFAGLAYPLFAFMRRLRTRHPTTQTSTSTTAHPSSAHTIASHAPLIIIIVVIAVAAIMLAIILRAAFRYLEEVESTEAERGPDPRIVREILAEPSVTLFRPFKTALGPVRRLVKRRLGQAKKRGHARNADETLREWLTRQDAGNAKASQIYESIRYGNKPDTRPKQKEIEHAWPRK